MQKPKIPRPSIAQIVLCALGLTSVFLTWIDLPGTHLSIGMTLSDLMSNSDQVGPWYLILGTSFIAGTALSLIWNRAYLVQLSSLALLIIPMSDNFIVNGGYTGADLDALAMLWSMTGPGTMLAWSAVLCGLLLDNRHRLSYFVRRRLPSSRTKCKMDTKSSTDDPSPVQGPTMLAESLATIAPSRSGEVSQYQQAIAIGEEDLERGELSSALRAFGKALGASNNKKEKAACKVKIALVLRRMDKLEEAHYFVQEAIRLDPDLTPGASPRGKSRAKRNIKMEG